MSELALLTLNPLFASGMMLQREKPVRVWGTSHAFDEITVTIQGQSVETKADESGQWEVFLSPLHASEKEMLTVSTESQFLIFEDVAVGEIWIAGGQSNMEFPIAFEKQRTAGRRWTDNANIRFFDIPEVAYPGQLEAFDYSPVNRWRKVTDEDIDYFSAVGYYFAEKLQADLNVPIGIIGCNWGGTRTMHWMSPESLKTVGKCWQENFEKQIEGLDLEAFFAKQNSDPMNDHGHLLEDPFTKFMLPRTPSIEEIGAFFAALMGGAAGNSNEAQAASANQTADAPTADPLANYVPPLTPQSFPGALFENMTKLAAPFTCRGVIWYQGESDDELAAGREIYDQMMKALISDWRGLWQDRLPFIQVQLAGFSHWLQTSCNDYVRIREQQKRVADTDPDTYLVNIGDAGQEDDIHPKDKATVGLRLALSAEQHIYGLPVCGDAPEAVSARRQEDRILVTFREAGEGLTIKGDALPDLVLTDTATGEIIPCTAEASGDTLILTPARMTDAMTLRFAKTNWHCINLYSSDGLPAWPFALAI